MNCTHVVYKFYLCGYVSNEFIAFVCNKVCGLISVSSYFCRNTVGPMLKVERTLTETKYCNLLSGFMLAHFHDKKLSARSVLTMEKFL